MYTASKKCLRNLLLTSVYALGIFGIVACGGSGSDDVEDPPLPPPPKIAGVWSGTWEGIESTLGPVFGTWEARVSQNETVVQGPVSFGGDIDCAEGSMTGTADGESQIVSGDVTRNPCPANDWEFTAFNQDEYIASGSWEKQGLSNGTFEGRRIATLTGPRIKYVYPPGANAFDYVTIVGERLTMDPINDSLTLGDGGIALIPITISDTLITFQLPGTVADSDHLVLKTSAGEALSPRPLNIGVTTPDISTTKDIALGAPDLLSTGIAASINGRRAFVANPGEGSVSMINVESGQEQTSTVILPGQAVPIPIHAMVVGPAGRRVYVAGDDVVGVLHAHTAGLMRTLTIPAHGSGQPNPQGIAVSPDGRWLLVSEAIDGGRVTVIDIDSDYTVADTLVMAAGNTPRGIATSPDNTHAYITVSGTDNEIWAYDFATAMVDAMISIGVSPASVAVTPDAGWLYVTNAPANTVNYYDLANGSSGEIDLGPGVLPTGLAITPDGLNVFVTSGTSSLQVINTSTKGITPVDVGGPSAGVAASPGGKRVFVTVPSLDKVVELSNQKILRISKQGGGIGTVTTSVGGIQCGASCTASIDAGETVQLTARPDVGSNSTFSHWGGDPDCQDGEVTFDEFVGSLFCIAFFKIPQSCFIATAAYGSWLDPHVVALRKFRDEQLLTNTIGTRLVEFYYRHSPPVADYIRERENLKAAVRAILGIIIFMIEYPVATGLLLLLAPFLVVRQRRRRQNLNMA